MNCPHCKKRIPVKGADSVHYSVKNNYRAEVTPGTSLCGRTIDVDFLSRDPLRVTCGRCLRKLNSLVHRFNDLVKELHDIDVAVGKIKNHATDSYSPHYPTTQPPPPPPHILRRK